MLWPIKRLNRWVLNISIQFQDHVKKVEKRKSILIVINGGNEIWNLSISMNSKLANVLCPADARHIIIMKLVFILFLLHNNI